MIAFNKRYFTAEEAEYAIAAIKNGHISGNGPFTKKCESFFEKRYGFKRCLLTTSCTAALEMCALLLDLGPGDEVIVPSYTFVSTANAFALRGAKVVFVDSGPFHPNMDASKVEESITDRTKAIVAVHYGGMACDMDTLSDIADKHQLILIEDAAQALDGHYKGKALGTFGALAAISFHETKNVNCGEGGMLFINDSSFVERAENIREKGTNRPAFFRQAVDKYSWVDLGSAYLPSDLLAAILFGQLQSLPEIQEKRKHIFRLYQEHLARLNEVDGLELPNIPDYTESNGHLFYLICRSEEERKQLIEYLDDRSIKAVFHYQSLHNSPYYRKNNDSAVLPNSERYAKTLLRLPFYYELEDQEVKKISQVIAEFYGV